MFVPGMNSNHKGAIAEAEIAAAAVRVGIPVLRPLSEHVRYDLGFEIGDRLWRVQRKWGHYRADAGVINVRVGGSRYTPNGYVLSTYGEGEIDLLAVHCGGLDRSYLIPAVLVTGRRTLDLRVAPTRNGQRACTNLASQYEFPGAVAQLGERAAGSRKVRGSSPLSSTPSSRPPEHRIGAHELRERFGWWMERAAAGEKVVVTRHGRPHVMLGPPDRELDAAPVASVTAIGAASPRGQP
jgi:prevent-host-death family protein